MDQFYSAASTAASAALNLGFARLLQIAWAARMILILLVSLSITGAGLLHRLLLGFTARGKIMQTSSRDSCPLLIFSDKRLAKLKLPSSPDYSLPHCVQCMHLRGPAILQARSICVVFHFRTVRCGAALHPAVEDFIATDTDQHIRLPIQRRSKGHCREAAQAGLGAAPVAVKLVAGLAGIELPAELVSWTSCHPHYFQDPLSVF